MLTSDVVRSSAIEGERLDADAGREKCQRQRRNGSSTRTPTSNSLAVNRLGRSVTLTSEPYELMK